jgi:acyl-CoA synthetase (AMP-forming)/AMP-acid ligase II
VIGVPDERWGEAVKAIVVLAPNSGVDGDELVAFARDRLAGYKLPRSVDFVSELPRSPAGKVLKRELRARYAPTGALTASTAQAGT